MAIAGIVTLVIITPVIAFSRSKSKWWRWWTLGKFASLGWTQEELNKVAFSVHGVNDNFLKTAKKVIEAGEKVKKSR